MEAAATAPDRHLRQAAAVSHSSSTNNLHNTVGSSGGGSSNAASSSASSSVSGGAASTATAVGGLILGHHMLSTMDATAVELALKRGEREKNLETLVRYIYIYLEHIYRDIDVYTPTP